MATNQIIERYCERIGIELNEISEVQIYELCNEIEQKARENERNKFVCETCSAEGNPSDWIQCEKCIDKSVEEQHKYLTNAKRRIAELERENEQIMWDCLYVINYSPAWDDKCKELREKYQKLLNEKALKKKEEKD